MSDNSEKIVSKSPERHTFQKEGYVRRQEEKGEPVSKDYLDYFQKIIEDDKLKFEDPESRINIPPRAADAHLRGYLSARLVRLSGWIGMVYGK